MDEFSGGSYKPPRGIFQKPYLDRCTESHDGDDDRDRHRFEKVAKLSSLLPCVQPLDRFAGDLAKAIYLLPVEAESANDLQAHLFAKHIAQPAEFDAQVYILD